MTSVPSQGVASAGRKLTIALDYDNTFTADPTFWMIFIQSALAAGHQVHIVTLRGWTDFDEDEYFRDLTTNLYRQYKVDTFLCDGLPKKEAVERYKVNIDIWIDDNPRGIYEGSRLSPEQLQKWRQHERNKAVH